MAFLTVGKENNADIDIYYEDMGSGKPVVLIHGWPLSGASWERQTSALLAAGYRVITYDRRGFGRSSKPFEGYDYNTLAGDLAKLIDALDLQDATIVGFSMGGGEVARYLGKYDNGRVAKAVFMAALGPALRHSADNPDGVDPKVFEGIKEQIIADRFSFLGAFLDNFYNKKLIGGSHISAEAVHASFNVASQSAYHAMLFCVDAWLEDFRADMASIKIPTLVIHGDADQILPHTNTGERTPKHVPHASLHMIEGGPHGLNWTHATEVNKALLTFLK